MKLQLTINCVVTGFMFGMWQQNFYAGLFVFVGMGFVLSAIDYCKRAPERPASPLTAAAERDLWNERARSGRIQPHTEGKER